MKWPEKYPSEEPLLEVEESENIDDEHLEELNTYLHDMLTENLGNKGISDQYQLNAIENMGKL